MEWSFGGAISALVAVGVLVGLVYLARWIISAARPDPPDDDDIEERIEREVRRRLRERRRRRRRDHQDHNGSQEV